MRSQKSNLTTQNFPIEIIRLFTLRKICTLLFAELTFLHSKKSNDFNNHVIFLFGTPSALLKGMNAQRKKEREIKSWEKYSEKLDRVSENNSWVGRARLQNTLASEMFDDDNPVEIDDLDFAMF